MPNGGGETATAQTINLNLNLTGDAVSALRRAGNEARRTARRVTLLGRVVRRARSAMATMTKALISMIAVLIAFNVFITLPQRIFQGITEAFKFAWKAAAAFEEQVLSLQAVLATTARFRTDPVENFIRAGEVATAVMEQLLLRSKETIASVEDTARAYQILVASGVGRYIQTAGEALDLTILLTNAISAVTQGQDLQRQLSEEIRSLMTQQLRATSMLGRLLFRNTAEMKAFFDQAAEGKTLLRDLQARLLPFVQAAERLGMTFTGIRTSFIDMAQRFGRLAISQVFGRILDAAVRFRNEVEASSDLFIEAAAAIGAALDTILDRIVEKFGLANFTAEKFLRTIIAYAPVVAGKVVNVATRLMHVADILRVIWAIVKISWAGFGVLIDVVGVGLSRLVSILEGLWKWFVAIAKAVKVAFVDYLGPEKLAVLEVVLGKMGATIVRAFSKFGEAVEDLPGIKQMVSDAKDIGDAFTKGWEKVRGYWTEIEAQYAKIKGWQDAVAVGAATEAEARAKISQIMEKIKKDLADVAALQEAMTEESPFDVERFLRPMLQELRIARRELRTMAIQARDFVAALGGTGRGLVLSEELDKVFDSLDKVNLIYDSMHYNMSLVQIEMDKMIARGEEETEVFKELEEALAAFEQGATEAARTAHMLQGALVDLFLTTGRHIEDALGRRLILAFWEQIKMMRKAAEEGKKLEFSLIDSFKAIIDFLKNNFEQVIFAVGWGMANMFTEAIVAGKGFVEAFKGLVADLLIAVGQWAIAYGTIMMFAGLLGKFGFGLKDVKYGALLVAAGTAALAAAAALGGAGGAGAAGVTGEGGGEERPAATYVSQKDIAVQQGVQDALVANTAAVTALQQEISRLSKEHGDVLVSGVIRKNPNTVLKPIGKKLGHSYSASTSFGKPLLGES